jgi:bifunctional DNA-binding transcriptional regulator/antitoxin component of YhaV-PrlF toxin-antitoxin module
MKRRTTKIAQGGRVVLDSEYRPKLGLKTGDEVVLELGEGEVRILSRSEAVRKAQALVRKHVRDGRSLVKELLKERRAEAEGE